LFLVDVNKIPQHHQLFLIQMSAINLNIFLMQFCDFYLFTSLLHFICCSFTFYQNTSIAIKRLNLNQVWNFFLHTPLGSSITIMELDGLKKLYVAVTRLTALRTVNSFITIILIFFTYSPNVQSLSLQTILFEFNFLKH
jgi:hypothetical protein